MGSMLIIAYFGPARAVPVKNTGGSRDTQGTGRVRRRSAEASITRLSRSAEASDLSDTPRPTR